MVSRTCLVVFAVLSLVQIAAAQADKPRPFEVRGIRVEGAPDERTEAFIVQRSGLFIGQTMLLPGDPALTEAIRTLYQFRQFADVKITEERREDDGVYLVIQVREEPRLAGFTVEGVTKKQQRELERKIPLLPGTYLRPSDVEWSRLIAQNYFKEQGYLLADVQIVQDTTGTDAVAVTFVVDRGPRVEVGSIVFEGNKVASDNHLRRQMQETRPSPWWRFWSQDLFDKNAYEEDLARLLAYYHELGHYDARIVGDTVYIPENSARPELVVEVQVYEGPPYTIRHITWEGNTFFSDDELATTLDIEADDPYNGRKLEQNLWSNPRSTDVASRYLNRGHMRFDVQPSLTVVAGDSLDLHIEIVEGVPYTFGQINIRGNYETKDHVIRRELYTLPGQTFSRHAIQESIRRLAYLNYFDQESLALGPEIRIDDEKQQVDLTYKVEETIKNPVAVAGTYGKTGFILALNFSHNNFSLTNLLQGKAWRPVPVGDGQRLSFGIQTGGRDFQRYSLGFTEPWFLGKPTPLGLSLSHTRIRDDFFSDTDTGTLINTSARVFYDQRLAWLDEATSLSTGVRFQHYNNDDWTESLPSGISREIVLQQSLTRNTQDHPFLPTRGLLTQLSVAVAPPFDGFIQYHKWHFQSVLNVPLAPRLTLGVSADFGYVGSLTGNDVTFERFVVGGSSFETQGISNRFGRDIIYLRGYPLEAIGPRQGETAIGGRILNTYTAELRWHAVQSFSLNAAPYLFFDAANTWNDVDAYRPADLFRSAGVGLRLVLPILGPVDVNYGYNFDTFAPIGKHDGERGWTFQISLGRIFGF